MALEIENGRIDAPERTLIYGPPGSGKTTLAASAKRPLFFSGEGGDLHLSVARVRFSKTPRRYHPISWDEVLKKLAEIRDEKDVGASTLVLDGMGAIENLCKAHVSEQNRWKHIGQPGYTRGEKALLAEMRVFLKHVEEIWTRGLGIIFVAHSMLAKAPNSGPSEDYKRHAPALTTVNDADVAGLITGWCNNAWFVTPEIETAKNDRRTWGVATGRNVVYTRGSGAEFVAKTRAPAVDDVLDLDWGRCKIWQQIEDSFNPDKLKAQILKLVEPSGNADMIKQARDFVAGPLSADPFECARIIGLLRQQSAA